MTEQTPQELLAAMTALLQQAGTQPPLGTTTARTGLGISQTANSGSYITGISIPVKVQMGGGSLRVYVALSAEACANQKAFEAALSEVERVVGPLDIWEKRNEAGLGSGKSYSRGAYNGGWR
ncbi:MAG: hypothetical protein RKO25_03920 [Candidatus Contendobacter sp.]|nr:hypothetical protein [Candidatus Contendobacter sp.]